MNDCTGIVLVVDDDSEIRQAVAEVLEDHGYHTTGAGNGIEALDVLRAGTRPCVILLDLMMPIMDGWQFRRAQLGDSGFGDIPVVVLTAHTDPDEVAGTNADAVLHKPVQLGALLETVGRFCDPAN